MSGALDSVEEPQSSARNTGGELVAAAGTPPPAILEKRRLVVEWPGKIRLGDSDLVRLILEIDENGSVTPTAIVAGNEVQAESVEIPNLYATHNILAEARLDMAGAEIVPADLVSQPMRPGERLEFIWSVKPEGVGILRGTVWLYLRFIPLSGGQESSRTLAAKTIEIETANLFGLSGSAARVLGVVGMVVGSFLGLDNLLAWGLNLFRRLFTRSKL